jgi:urease accessory protein
MKITITMADQENYLSPRSLMRQQTWLSPAFPTGSYSYSHGIEWAVEAALIYDRETLVDWLDADLRFGSGRNEAIFFMEAWRCATNDEIEKLLEVAEFAAAYRGTAEFTLESSQQAAACLATLCRVWPDAIVEKLSGLLSEHHILPSLSVVLGVHSARQSIPSILALAAFLQSYVANLITAGVRLIPLGQTDGQLAIAELEDAVLTLSEKAQEATFSDLGSAAFMVDLASAFHETQYTRLFRS